MTEDEAHYFKKGDLVAYADTVRNAHKANAIGVVTESVGISESLNKRMYSVYWFRNNWLGAGPAGRYKEDSLKLLSKKND